MSNAAQTKSDDGSRLTHATWSVPVEVMCKSRELAGGLGPSDEHLRIAEYALKQTGDFDPHAPFQAALLARELWFYLRHLLGRVWEQELTSANDLGMLPADAFALHYIERLGDEGKVAAESLGKLARSRWAAPSEDVVNRNYLWRNWHRTDHPATSMSIAGVLACVLWRDVVKPKLKRAPCPAVGAAVLDAAIATLWNEHPKSIWLHRIFRWLVNTAFAHELSSSPDGDIEVVGGLSGLAKQMDGSGGRARDDVGKALELMQNTRTAPGRKPWLTFSVRPAAPGRPATMRIRPHDALYPNYVSVLSNRSRAQRLEKSLVPIPQNLPPLCGRNNDHGLQCTLELVILKRFRRKAVSLASHGSVCLSDADWEEMAREAKVNPATTPRIVEAWTHNDKRREGLLRRRGEQLYAFAPAWRAPGMLIVQGAQKQINGLKAQRRGRRRFAAKP